MYNFLLIVLICLLALDFYKNRKIVTPGIVFNGIFFVTLFLYRFQISEIQHDLLPRTLLILWLSVIFFNIIVFIYYFTHKKIEKPDFVSFNEFYSYGISDNALLWCRYIVLFVFFVEIIYSKGVPLIWKFTGSSLTYFDFGIPSVNGAFCGLVMILGSYTLFKKGIDKYIYLSIGLLIISRQLIITIVVEGVFFKILTNRKQIKHLILKLFLLLVVGVALFSVIGNMRTGEQSFLEVGQFKTEYDWIPTSFKWLYSYMCFSVSNFNELVSLTYGLENFGASMLNTVLPTVISRMFYITEKASYYYLVSPNFTVSTCYPELYLDFGLFGIIGHSVFIALLCVWSFNNFTINGNLKYAAIYTVAIHNIILFFFNNMFIYLPVLSQFIYIPMLFVKRKKECLIQEL